MSDRIKGLYVTLDHDYRDDDVEAIVAAVRMVKGVAAVATEVTDSADWMARERVRFEVKQKLYQGVSDAFSEPHEP